MRPLAFPRSAFSFPSGLQVLIERDPRTSLAGVFVVVGAGSSSDPVGKEGLAHFVEHLTFLSRPPGLPAGERFDSALLGAGAVWNNAGTSFDSTVYFELGLAADLPALLRLEGARMRAAVIDVDPTARTVALDVVRSEVRLRSESGYRRDVLGELQAALFPAGHPYARPVSGDLASLGGLTDADVQAFVQTWYRPDNMTLVVTGDVDVAQTVRLLETTLPPEIVGRGAPVRVSQRIPDEPPEVPPSPPAAAVLVAREAQVASPEVWLGWSLPRSLAATGWRLELLASAARRRLSREAKADDDIAAVRVQTVPGVEASMLLLQLELYKGTHPERSRDLILEELSHVWTSLNRRAEVVDELAFAFERRMVFVQGITSAQDLEIRGLTSALTLHFAQDLDLFAQSAEALGAVRRPALAGWANRYFTAERARSVLLVPAKGAAVPTTAEQEDRASVLASTPPDSDAAAGWETARVHALLDNRYVRNTFRLGNGLSVVLEPRPGVPVVHAEVVLPSPPASAADLAAARIAAAIGSPQYGLNAPPRSYGAAISSLVGADHFAYVGDAAAGNLESLLARLAEEVSTQAVGRGSFGWYQQHVVPLVRHRSQAPAAVAARQFLGALLDGSAYGLQPTCDDLADLSASNVRGWIGRTHVPSGATLVITGEFDRATVTQMILDAFEGWSGGAPPPAPPEPALPASIASELTLQTTALPGASQTHLRFGCRLPRAAQSADVARHRVAAAVLDGRLHALLRERMGATYFSRATSGALRGGTAWLEVVTTVDDSKLAPALAAVRQTLTDLAERPAGSGQLAWAKVRLAGGSALAQMTDHDVAAEVRDLARLGFPLDAAGRAQELEQVSEEDVRGLLQACLRGRPTLSALGNEPAARAAVEKGWYGR